MLKIIPPSEPIPVENIVVTEYSQPGTGKTSLAFTADRPLLLDADKGSHRAANINNRVIVSTWSDVAALSAEDLEPYSSVIIDTAGTLITKLMAHLIQVDPKNGGSYGGMSGKGWTNVNTAIDILVQKIISAKKDLIFVCHMDETEKGGDIKERIDAVGKPKNTIYRVSDAMCRILIQPNGTRVLDFNPSDGGYGKNPAMLPLIPFPHPDKQTDTMAKVIAQIKAYLNRNNEKQAEAIREQEQWEADMQQIVTIPDAVKAVRMAGDNKLAKDCATKRLLYLAVTLAEFNEHFVPLMKEMKGEVLTQGVMASKERGWKADKSTGLYVEGKKEA